MARVPLFGLLERVRVKDTPEMVAAGEGGRIGAVLQIRRYGYGTYTYSVGYMIDDGIGGLYPEEHLESLNEFLPTADHVLRTDEAAAQSLRVSGSGELTGVDEYVVVAEVTDAFG
jgi:hypothetical protein